MRTFALLLFMMSLAYTQNPSIEPGVSHELAKWRAAHYSNVRYKISLTLEKMSPVLRGTIEVRVLVRDAVTGGRGDAVPIVLDWRKIRGHEEKSTVSRVSINGTVLSPPISTTPSAEAAATPPIQEGSQKAPQTQNTFEESNEHLIFRDGVVAGENVIKLDFTSPILPSGSAITRYIDKEDGSEYIYSLFVPSDASTAFPVFDQPDLKARFKLHVTTEADWKIVSNTVHSDVMNLPLSHGPKSLADTLGRTFEETKPISTYVFAFAAGPWQQVSEPRAVSTGSPQEIGITEGRTSLFSRESGDNKVASGEGPRTSGPNTNDTSSTEGAKQTSRTSGARSLDDLTRRSAFGSTTGYHMSAPPVQKNGPACHIYVRKSQLAKFQPHSAEVFRLNREAVKYFEEYFDYKFPFPKYDLVLIPEFPFGGMEHAGATFLRESSIIFPQEPTKNDIASRATLIFHEASHQWFGDTVTMRWFDDLWLKEGFATFTAYKAMEKIMPEMNSWKIFYERIKQGAYQTDSTKGTTAIYQPIANLSAAKSAYGNIVYNKAPAFLRQAEFYLGEEKFRTAVRAFLKKHEFANAGWEDLVNEFESVSKDPRNLSEWAEIWVKRGGVFKIVVTSSNVKPNRLKYNFSIDPWYKSEFPENKDSIMYFNSLVLYGDGTRESQRLELVPVRVSTLPVAFVVKRPVAIIPNYQDYGYGIFLLDNKSRNYILKNIQNEKDPFLRSMMWGALWDSVREGELDPKEYVELGIRVQSASFSSSGDGEERDKSRTLNEDESTTATILNRISTAMTYYIDDKARDAIAPRLEAMLIEKMRHAPTLGQRITYYRAFLNIAASEKARGVLKELLRQESVPSASADGSPRPNAERGMRSAESNPKSKIQNPKSNGIPLKTKDRFDIITKLASLGDPEADKLLGQLEKTETSDDAKRYAYAARAAFATKETKAKYWNDFIANKEISESWIEAAFGPFNSVRHADLTLPYLERALKELPNHKRNRKIFFVNGWLGAFIGGQRSAEALAIVNKFLAENPNLDRDLRLKILENVDIIERAVKIRGKFATR